MSNLQKLIAEAVEGFKTISTDHAFSVREADLSDAALRLMQIEKMQDLLKSMRESTEERIVTFSDQKKVKGTENLQLGGGWKIQVVKKVTTSIAGDENDIEDLKVEISSPNKDLVFKKKTSFSLDNKVYAELPSYDQEIVDRLVMVKPAKTTVKIIGPKDDKA